jgi:hypothetical protein
MSHGTISSVVPFVSEATPDTDFTVINDDRQLLNIEFYKMGLSNFEKTSRFKYGVGTIIRFLDGKIYLLTSYHTIIHSRQYYMYYEDSKNKHHKVKLNYLIKMIEFDLSLFSIVFDDLLLEIQSEINDNAISIDLFKESTYQKEKENIQSEIIINKNTKYDCQIIKTRFGTALSENIKNILLIDVVIHSDNKLDLNSFSGAPVMIMKKEKENNNKKEIVGIVSFCIEETISLISSMCVVRFLKEYIQNNSIIGICIPVCEFKPCDITTTESTESGLLIGETYGINYNNFIYDIKKKCVAYINSGDIITHIESNPLNQDGLIYCSKSHLLMPITTYIMLNYFVGDIIQITVLKFKEVLKTYETTKISLRARPLSSIIKIPYISPNNYYIYKNMVFTELSEELCKRTVVTDKKNYNNMLEKIDYYDNDSESRTIILADILYLKMSNAEIKFFTNNKIYSKSFKLVDKYPIITKINRKKIYNLLQMKSYITELKESRSNITLTAITKSNPNLKILI